jgi:protein-S-isoprenylcysteine O-methyltransferase Ste14
MKGWQLLMGKQTNDNAGVLFPPPLLFVAAFVLGQRLQSSFPLPLLLPKTLRIFLGGALVGTSITTAALAVREMRSAGTSVQPQKPTTALVVEGPYRFTRNPLYLSMTLLYSGLTLLTNALWPLLLLPIALQILKRGVIQREERYLEHKFGEQYQRYKESVPRWL